MKKILAILSCMILCAVTHIYGASFTITSTADSGPGTLRNIIATTNSNPDIDQIYFDGALDGTPLQLTSAISITEEVHIFGFGGQHTMIDFLGGSGGFNIPAGVRVEFHDVGIAGSVTSGAGAAINCNGQVMMLRTIIESCSSGDQGGAVSIGVDGDIFAIRCNFLDNTADFGGGAIFMDSSSTGNFTNCLFFNNQAIVTGAGAISLNNADVTFANNSIVGNSTAEVSASACGGMEVKQAGGVFLNDNILADNMTGSGQTDFYGSSLLGINDANYVEFNSGSNTFAYSDVGEDFDPPVICGSVFGLPPKAGSPAIDNGGASAQVDDICERLHSIPGDPIPDIGCSRYDPPPATYIVTNTNDAGPGSLRDAMAQANSSAATDFISFDLGIDGAAIVLTSGEIQVLVSVVIQGNGPENTIIDASTNSRIFDVVNGVDPLTLLDLTLKGGNSTGNGGAIRSFGVLDLNNVNFESNDASGNGGAIYANYGSGAIKYCTFEANTSGSYGGAIAVDTLTGLHIENNSFTNNSTGISGGAFASLGPDNSINFIHNTMYLNSTLGSGVSKVGGIYSQHFLTSPISMSNNIVWGNTNATGNRDLYDSAGFVAFNDVNIVGVSLLGTWFSTNDPLLVSSNCLGKVVYKPSGASAAIDNANGASIDDICFESRSGAPDIGAAEAGPDCNINIYNSYTTDPNLCYGAGTHVVVTSSDVGIDYVLINVSDSSLVAGPISGTGDTILLFTGDLFKSETFFVEADNGAGCFQPYPDISINIIDTISDMNILPETSVCAGNTAEVTLAVTEPGVNYFLINTDGFIIVDGPIVGTGDTMFAYTDAMNVSSAFMIQGDKGFGCTKDFDLFTVIAEVVADRTVLADAAVCLNSAATIKLVASEPLITYSLHRTSDNAQIGPSQTGNSDTLYFSTGLMSTPVDYYIKATSDILCTKQFPSFTIGITELTAHALYELEPVVCVNGNTDIVMTSSDLGVNYYLYDMSSNPVTGPIAGTGDTLWFNTGALTSNETFSIFADNGAGCTKQFGLISITVSADEFPVALCQPFLDIFLDSTISRSITWTDLDAGSYDLCDPTLFFQVQGQLEFTCNDIGQTFELTLEVKDGTNNTSTCLTEVAVIGPRIFMASNTATINAGDQIEVPVTYNDVNFVEWTPSQFIDDPFGLNPQVSPEDTTTYYVKGWMSAAGLGCEAVDSFTVNIEQAIPNLDDLIVYELVTPNGDGANDFLTVNEPLLLQGRTIWVYDRAGRNIYNTVDYNNDWNVSDGDGRIYPDGVYYYEIFEENNSGEGSIPLKKGTFTVIGTNR